MPEKSQNNLGIVIPLLRAGGGAEKVASWLSRELVIKNKTVCMATFWKRENEHEIGGKRFNFQIDSRLPSIVMALFRAKKIAAWVKNENLSVVLSFTEEAAAALVLSKLWGCRAKIFLAVRNNPKVRSSFSRLFISLFYPWADKVIANSGQMASLLREDFKLKQVETIFNPCFINEIEEAKGVSLPSEDSQIYNGFVFISIGRLVAQKGYGDLIDSFLPVTKKYPATKLVILGTGYLEGELKSRIAELSLENNVFILGFKPNVYSYIDHSQVSILNSYWEGFPNVLLDSLALNKPCLAADCETGPREILAPEAVNKEIQYPYYGKYGILLPVQAKEKIPCLTREMLNFIENKELMEKYSHGKERASSFNPGKIISEWERLLFSE